VPKLRHLLDLSWSDRRLLLEALLVVPLMRLGLTLLPFGWMRWIELLIADGPLRRVTTSSPERIAGVVTVVAKYVPAASCLTQALSTRALLALHGYPSRLHIGVVRGEDGALLGHAWVECHSQIVIGGVGAPLEYALLVAPENGPA
jgi:hypothetical protein